MPRRRIYVTLKDIVNARRAYRSLGPVRITEDVVWDLAGIASLAPSCFNKQPWRFLFVTDKDLLRELEGAMSKGNEWTSLGSMVIVVFSKQELDCVIRDRLYYMFDTGMATALLILRATEMGLVAHPIAGFSPKRVRTILGIPEDMDVISLIIVGRMKEDLDPLLSEQQALIEKERPERASIDDYAFLNKYPKETSDNLK